MSEGPRRETLVERVLGGSRFVLLVFYMGLALSLVLYAVAFAAKLVKLATNVLAYDDATMILAMLGLIDAVLVANLVVMVLLSGYRNFVGLDEDGGSFDAGGSLKVKLASSIVAISAIHLLQLFLTAGEDGAALLTGTAVHLAFVASAVILAVIDRLGSKGKA